ncbi:MAG: family 16 glycosylhydrolase [Planctomycetota bacterium]
MHNLLILTLAAVLLAALNAVRAGEPNPTAAPKIERDKEGLVRLTAEPGMEIRYWLTGPEATPSSVRYTAPFHLELGGTVKALAIAPDGSGRTLDEKAVASAEFPPLEGAQPHPPAAQPTFHEAGWHDFKLEPFVPVKRTSDDFPLSDQENKGGWVKYEPMSDEFNGDKLDEAKWWPFNPTWKGRYPGLFRKENVTVSGGQLHLTMKKEPIPETETDKKYKDYTCAAVQSKDTVRYGYFEVRSRAMKSAGSSSFWFYLQSKPWWTEIDVYEIGGKAPGKERNHHITMHFWHSPVADKHWQVGSHFLAPANLCDDYHVFGVEWSETELKFFFDGRLVRRGPNTDWHQPQTLNFDSETMPDWFGMPKDEDLPSTFSIDYVRAWKRK